MKLFSSETNIVTPSAATKRMLAQEFAMLKQRKQTLTIMILLLICMMGWGIVSVFSSQRASKVDATTTALAKQLNPVIDITVLNSLETKRSFTDEELSNFTIYKVVVDPKTQEEVIMTIDEDLPPPESALQGSN